MVERTHLTLKNALYKQKGGIGEDFRSPRDKLNIILFILNFLTLDKNGRSAAERHDQQSNPKHLPKVLWKDVLEGTWKGLDPVIIWTRGLVCVFPQDQQNPVWVPECLICRVENPRAEVQDDLTASAPAVDPTAGNGGAENAVGSGEGVASATPSTRETSASLQPLPWLLPPQWPLQLQPPPHYHHSYGRDAE